MYEDIFCKIETADKHICVFDVCHTAKINEAPPSLISNRSTHLIAKLQWHINAPQDVENRLRISRVARKELFTRVPELCIVILITRGKASS